MADIGLRSSFETDETPCKQKKPSTLLNIRIEPGILDYTKHGSSTTEDVFQEAVTYIYNLRSVTQSTITKDELVNQMTMLVYGSNMIEQVGTNRAETIQLCQKVFLGEGLCDITPRSPEYHQHLETCIRSETQKEEKKQERLEVINHAMALMHMIESVIQDDKPFSEDLIKETHAILCSSIPVVIGENETIQSHIYAGKYRTLHIHAGSTNFVTPNRIGPAMTRFIHELNDHLLRAEKNQEIDPFFTAAHACGAFVNIHPFLDGNGRTCRIILNTILLKYAGVVCPFGEHDSERREYINIAKRRSEHESGNGELAWYILKKSIPSLRRLQDRTTIP